jgi:hypothetical protein
MFGLSQNVSTTRRSNDHAHSQRKKVQLDAARYSAALGLRDNLGLTETTYG